MNIIRFIFNGIEGKQNQYRRNHFPQDSEIVRFRNIDSFTGKITQSSQTDQVKTIEIDNAYTFATLSDKIRNDHIKIWTHLKNGTKITGRVKILTSFLGIATAITLALALPHFLIIALAVGVVSVAVFGISFLSTYRSHQAAQQLKLWEDPTNKYIIQCKEHHTQFKLSEMTKSVDATKDQFSAQRQKYREDLAKKVQGFVDQIKNLDDSTNPEFKDSMRATLIKTISNQVDLFLILKTVSKDDAYAVLKPYFNDYPELKEIADKLHQRKI